MNAQTGTSTKTEAAWPFALVLLYLVLEYGRPQSLIPGLSALRLPAIVSLLIGAALFLKGKIRFEERQTRYFVLILGLMVIHGPIAVNNYWALMIFIGMGLNFVAYLALARFVDRRARYERLLRVWLGIHVFLAIVAIVKGGRGVGGFLGDENDICMTLNMFLPFVFFEAFGESRAINRAICLGILCVVLLSIVMTFSRGGFVGLAAVAVYLWIRSNRKMIFGLGIALAAVFLLLVAPAAYWDDVRSIHEEGTQRGTGSERIYTWTVGWEMFKDNPILGVGQGNFPFVFEKYERELGFEEGFRGRSRAGRAAHSLYFTLLPELGLIGTLLYLGMVVQTFRDLQFIRKTLRKKSHGFEEGEARRYRDIAMALEGSLVSFLVSGAFISVLYYPNFWILQGFALSFKHFVLGTAHEGRPQPHIPRHSK